MTRVLLSLLSRLQVVLLSFLGILHDVCPHSSGSRNSLMNEARLSSSPRSGFFLGTFRQSSRAWCSPNSTPGLKNDLPFRSQDPSPPDVSPKGRFFPRTLFNRGTANRVSNGRVLGTGFLYAGHGSLIRDPAIPFLFLHSRSVARSLFLPCKLAHEGSPLNSAVDFLPFFLPHSQYIIFTKKAGAFPSFPLC